VTQNIQEIIDYKGEDRVVHYQEYLLERVNRPQVKRFQSGWALFDGACALEPGEVVIVTGHTKNGKTLFAESWIRRMMQSDASAKAMILSFEVQTEKLLQKYAPDDIPVYVPRELKTMDFEWLKFKCREAKYKYGCTIVMIDHLHFMVDMATKQNMSLNIGAFLRRLKKEIAIDEEMAVLLLAHQGQPKDEASLGNLRDSSFIAQEADAVLIVSRKENLSPIELNDIRTKHGGAKASALTPPETDDEFQDKFSAGLAIVKVAVHRRTSVFDWKKMFQKRGEWMEEA